MTATAVQTVPPILLTDLAHAVLFRQTWKFYEELLSEIGDRPLRVTFDHGNLEMMAPLQTHEMWKSRIGRLIERMAEERTIEIESLGSTTFKLKDLDQGLEPDECFYIANYRIPRTKQRLDLKVDPPPDLAVEIDITRRSVAREPIYAGLGVPELWRFDGKRLQVLGLENGEYSIRDSSLSFPFLPMREFERYVLRFDREDQAKVLREFRDWVGTLPNP